MKHTQINRASSGPLSLSIHDNRFVEDRASGDTDHWGTSMLLCHNRFATRDGSGNAPVRIYNNIDETWGGLTMSNSQAYDIYDNVFNGCSDAIYNGHGCPDTAGQTFGNHRIYGNIFRNASDDLHPGASTPAIDWQYYGSGGGTHLPSVVEGNLFEHNDTAVRFGMDTDMTYPVHVVGNNCFIGNGLALNVGGSYASTLNAENNWWGENSGPYHAVTNADGIGDEVSDFVDYDPWLMANYTGGTVFEWNQDVVLETTFSDSDGTALDGLAVEFFLDGNSKGSGVTSSDGKVAINIGPQPVGVYEVQASAGCLSVSSLIAVYDPSAGFVTGGGWIYSEPGAYKADENLSGKATFGFVSKYNKKTKLPEGNTEFVFNAADLNFHSSSYDWLIVNQNGTNAQFKGAGTINGQGDYKFMLWAGDGEPDTFRIKIWWEENDTEHVVYDNGVDQSIAGGNIVVHTTKKK